MDSENTRLQRTKRYMQVSAALGQAGYQYGVQKIKGEGGGLAHAQDLFSLLGGLKGPVMKVAQMLASIPDALPPEYTKALQKLQTQAPAMGIPFVKRRMTSELGAGWLDRFQSFTMNASAAASLGQVHQAVSLTGKKLACKLQYPYMMAHLEADLKQLKWFLKAYEWSFKTLETDDLYEEVCDRLREELDYTREQKHLLIFQDLWKHHPFIHVPKPYPELSTARLLTMDWLEGIPLQETEGWTQNLRNTIAQNLFKAWYEPLYTHGILHSDPHLGNYTIRPDGSINVFDFGCVRFFEPDVVQGIVLLYHALQHKNHELAVQAYQLWGFSALNDDLIQVLNRWAGVFYEPLLDNRVRPIQKGFSAQEGRQVAEEVHQHLRRLGGIKPPRGFLFLDRVAVGLGAACMHLRAELNWHILFEHCIQNFNPKALLSNQTLLLKHHHWEEACPNI